MKEIVEIARENDLYVVEDAAESHGAQYNGQKVGSSVTLAASHFTVTK